MFKLNLDPETITMLPFALMLDAIGILLLCTAGDDYGITDIIGILFINGWLLFRGEKTVNIKKVKQKADNIINIIQRLFTQKPSKFFITGLLELIPCLGALLPFWTIGVLLNLTEEE